MVRIPIRKWEKVTRDPLGYRRDRYADEFASFRCEDHYRLEVLINGEILGVDARVPAFLQHKDAEAFRKHIIASLSSQIAAVVADEIRRTIV